MPAAPPPPPPPSLGVPPSGSAQPDDRGQLLKSIRAGATLRKTVTVDKSAPAIAGKVRDASGSGGTGGGGSGCATSGRPAVGGPNLGGLFSAGMPKLKATGLRNNAAEQESAIGTPSVKRGPPPIPPPATQKPSSETSPEQPHVHKSFGKPTLAPKPPPPPASSTSSFGHAIQKPSPPPKKLNLIGGAASVSRAQSMRLPRSPPVLAHATPSSLHQSQDCLNETVAAAQHRPVGINRALRPPIARPPSPPISRIPREAPPPPATRLAPPPPPPPPSRLAVVTAPSMPPPPPPPPYRSTSMHQRLAPPPPPPPTPPTRLASANAPSILVRNGPPTLANLDLELRFADKFHSIVNFPNPSPFRGFPKVYNSKNAAKQQAPGPPPSSAPGTMLRSNDSSGGLLLLNSGEASRQRHRPLEN